MAIKIFIDQGHNPSGVNTGAEGNGLKEQDVTYEVGRYLYNLLTEDPNFEARLSRPTADTVLGTSNRTSLAQRVYLANSWPADYFLSIHTNGSTNPALNGTEVYVYREDSPAYFLALEILNAIVERMGTADRGVKTNRSLYVLRNTDMPAALIELAFISNASDAQKLENDPQGFATAIYRGLRRYFGITS